MARIEVALDERQEQRLRAFATQQAVSMEEAARRCLDKALPQSSRDPQDLAAAYARAARLVGAFQDPEGATDLATNHDHYLYSYGD